MGGTRGEARNAARSRDGRRRAGGVAVALVLGMHFAALERWGAAAREPVAPAPLARALTVRIVAAAPAAGEAAASARPETPRDGSNEIESVRPTLLATAADRVGTAPPPPPASRRSRAGPESNPVRLGRSPPPAPIARREPPAPLPVATPVPEALARVADAGPSGPADELAAPEAPGSIAPSTLDDAEAPARARPVRFVPNEPLVAAAPEREPPASEPDPETEPIPHYRTRVPPSVLLRYDVRRGGLAGVGQIDWRTDGSHYDLKLDFRYLGLTILQQASSGGFDADGLAPQRFVDQRIRRAAQAANFQRGANKLSYSASSDEFMLRAGAQDRLSWMVQLAAIVAADPALGRPGGRVTMFVTGARADIAVWTFRAVGPEPFELRSGTIETVKFVREARREHDISVQAWLDPARGYLPAAASQQSGPADEPYELRLLEAVTGR